MYSAMDAVRSRAINQRVLQARTVYAAMLIRSYVWFRAPAQTFHVIHRRSLHRRLISGYSARKTNSVCVLRLVSSKSPRHATLALDVLHFTVDRVSKTAGGQDSGPRQLDGSERDLEALTPGRWTHGSKRW